MRTMKLLYIPYETLQTACLEFLQSVHISEHDHFMPKSFVIPTSKGALNLEVSI